MWDVDSIGLIEILARLNRGEDQAGSPIGQQASFTIACALDPTAADAATEWDRLERKLAAGAHVVMTQPLYDAAQVERCWPSRGAASGRAGSRSRCCWACCRWCPPATRSSSTTRSRASRSPTRRAPGCATRAPRGTEAGIDMADALLSAVGDEVAGTYLMPSFGRYEQAAELVRRIRARHPMEAAAAS